MVIVVVAVWFSVGFMVFTCWAGFLDFEPWSFWLMGLGFWVFALWGIGVLSVCRFPEFVACAAEAAALGRTAVEPKPQPALG
jgi:hypothetical protein